MYLWLSAKVTLTAAIRPQGDARVQGLKFKTSMFAGLVPCHKHHRLGRARYSSRVLLSHLSVSLVNTAKNNPALKHVHRSVLLYSERVIPRGHNSQWRLVPQNIAIASVRSLSCSRVKHPISIVCSIIIIIRFWMFIYTGGIWWALMLNLTDVHWGGSELYNKQYKNKIQIKLNYFF